MYETEQIALNDLNFDKIDDDDVPEAGSIWGSIARPVPLPPMIQSQALEDSIAYSTTFSVTENFNVAPAPGLYYRGRGGTATLELSSNWIEGRDTGMTLSDWFDYVVNENLVERSL